MFFVDKDFTQIDILREEFIRVPICMSRGKDFEDQHC